MSSDRRKMKAELTNEGLHWEDLAQSLTHLWGVGLGQQRDCADQDKEKWLETPSVPKALTYPSHLHRPLMTRWRPSTASTALSPSKVGTRPAERVLRLGFRHVAPTAPMAPRPPRVGWVSHGSCQDNQLYCNRERKGRELLLLLTSEILKLFIIFKNVLINI